MKSNEKMVVGCSRCHFKISENSAFTAVQNAFSITVKYITVATSKKKY